MLNSVLWADLAHGVFIGIHGNSDAPETIANATFKEYRRVEVREEQSEYQGAIAISAGNSNLVRDITFEDIRVERITKGKLFNVRGVNNDKYNTSRGVENAVHR